jgi:3-oxoacyl-[acyl-carrier-protein] synthase-1
MFPTCQNLEEFSSKLFAGKSLIRTWDEAVAHGKKMRSTVAGYISVEESGLEAVPSTLLENYPEIFKDKLERIPIENLATADLGSIWAMLGAQDVIRMSGWTTGEVQSERMGVVIGSGAGGNEVSRKSWHNFFVLDKKTRFLGSHNVDRCRVYRDAANVSCLIQSKGVCESIGSACATGLGNIGYAYRLIAFGLQDRIVAGGIEGTSMESFIGFDAMQVLSRGFEPERSSRPFDTDRNGFVCSFGAGIVALEDYEMAKARGQISSR